MVVVTGRAPAGAMRQKGVTETTLSNLGIAFAAQAPGGLFLPPRGCRVGTDFPTRNHPPRAMQEVLDLIVYSGAGGQD
jgi:hypothetical protein